MLKEILKHIFPDFCHGCSRIGTVLCPTCNLKLRHHFSVRELGELTVYSAMNYEDELLKALIYSYKFHRQKSLSGLLASLLHPMIEQLLAPEECVLVPVPLHPSRKRERGFNQSELLALELCRRFDFEYCPALVRAKQTRSLAKLENRAAREDEIYRAFRQVKALPKNKHVLLIDDIVTSGSTLQACLEALSWRHTRSPPLAITLAHREITKKNSTPLY